MALTTVVRTTPDGSEGEWRALCSCGWQGEKTTNVATAHTEKRQHKATHFEPGPLRGTETR